MCTVTLIAEPQGLRLTMNRDERRERHEAGLHHTTINGIELAYPVDGEAGGTWAGINANGVAMALLNRYQEPHSEQAVTRGKIIVDALAKGNLDQVRSHIEALDCHIFNPFDLLLVDYRGGYHLSWNGQRATLSAITAPMMISSSSERLEEVLAYRAALFSVWQQDYGSADQIDRFHLQQADGEARSAVLMSRDYSHSKSLTQIALRAENETGIGKESSLNYYRCDSLKENARLLNLKPDKQLQLTANHQQPQRATG